MLALKELRRRWKNWNRIYVERFRALQRARQAHDQKLVDAALEELTATSFYPDRWLEYARPGLALPRSRDIYLPRYLTKVGGRYCFDANFAVWRCQERVEGGAKLPVRNLSSFRSCRVGWTLVPPELNYFVLVTADGRRWAGFLRQVLTTVTARARGRVRASLRYYPRVDTFGLFLWDDEGWLGLMGQTHVPAVVCVDLPAPPGRLSVWA